MYREPLYEILTLYISGAFSFSNYENVASCTLLLY